MIHLRTEGSPDGSEVDVVKCPDCHNVWGEEAPVIPTRVLECPRCGERGKLEREGREDHSPVEIPLSDPPVTCELCRGNDQLAVTDEPDSDKAHLVGADGTVVLFSIFVPPGMHYLACPACSGTFEWRAVATCTACNGESDCFAEGELGTDWLATRRDAEVEILRLTRARADDMNIHPRDARGISAMWVIDLRPRKKVRDGR